jgi:hypothetical protein
MNDLCHIRVPVWGRWFYDIAPQADWNALREGLKEKDEIPRSAFTRHEYITASDGHKLIYDASGLSFAELVESLRPQVETQLPADAIATQLAKIINKALQSELGPDECPIASGGASFDIESGTGYSHAIIPQCRLPAELPISPQVESRLASVFDESQTLCKAVPTEEYGRSFQIVPLGEVVKGAPTASVISETPPSVVVEMLAPDWFLVYGKRFPKGGDVASAIHKAVIKWLTSNPDKRVRATLPIVHESQTVAVHLWVDATK